MQSGSGYQRTDSTGAREPRTDDLHGYRVSRRGRCAQECSAAVMRNINMEDTFTVTYSVDPDGGFTPNRCGKYSPQTVAEEIRPKPLLIKLTPNRC
ncbi:hypothetical protein J6590_066133 [Homalodisca vitripennis]|nr:hypothetical protein J6590_066133 [Homalodisca vitripennis]